MSKEVRSGRVALLAALALSVSACAGTIKNMHEVAPGSPEPKPAPGKALIIFMRPSGFGYAFQSSVFAMKDKNPEFVGILAAKAKVAWQVDPGQHLFMVVGESGDFMTAEVEPGKTYFALVTPRMGMWKARFSLAPVSAESLGSQEFAGWLSDCRWVEKEQTSEAWYRETLPDIRSRYDQYYPEWMQKPEAERPRLKVADGR
jgi:hypothetical protein